MNTQSSQKRSLDGVRRCLPPALVLPVRSAQVGAAASRQEEAPHASSRPLTTYEPIMEQGSFRKESVHHSRFSLDLTSVRVHLGDATKFFVVLLAKIRGTQYLFFTSPKRALYISLASGVAFGVFLTAITFTLFDQGVSAQSTLVDEISVEAAAISPESESMAAPGTSLEGDDVFLEYFS